MTTAKLLVLGLLALLGAVQDPAPAPAKPKPELPKVTYVLVVNASNTAAEAGEAARSVVKRLFLKDLTQWPDGTEAKPYRRPDGTDAQRAFLAAVLAMSDAELARHWLRIKNQDGSTPPKEVDSDRMALKYVARYAGAFCVVPKEAVKDAEGVRVLFEFQGP